jgi:hypothetical protein
LLAGLAANGPMTGLLKSVAISISCLEVVNSVMRTARFENSQAGGGAMRRKEKLVPPFFFPQSKRTKNGAASLESFEQAGRRA